MFIDIRDRHGVTQVVARDDEALVADAKRLRSEFVVAVIGRVERRARRNRQREARDRRGRGRRAREFRLLNDAKTPPFPIADEIEVTEETRLKHRYLDLRRPRMQHNMILRHRVTMAIRQYFDEHGFLEIETPILDQVDAGRRARLPGAEPRASRRVLRAAAVAADLQADPDDRRAWIATSRSRKLLPRRGPARRPPARVHAGRPRDVVRDRGPGVRDARAADGAADGAHRPRGADALPAACRTPRRSRQYGSDKPDLRCGMEIARPVASRSPTPSSRVFRDAIDAGGEVRGFVVPGAAQYSRRELDELVEQAQAARRRGTGVGAQRRRRRPELRAQGRRRRQRSAARSTLAGAGPADLLLMAAGPHEPTSQHARAAAAATRQEARTCSTPTEFEFLWVVDFPMFEWVEDEKRCEFMHHPFTAPLESDAAPARVAIRGSARARAYDLVLNGSEIGGGSIRIHDQALQRLHLQAARHLGRGGAGCASASSSTRSSTARRRTAASRSASTASSRSSAARPSIREVIAFPKTAQAVDLMAGAPSTVSDKQLRELQLKSGLRTVADVGRQTQASRLC